MKMRYRILDEIRGITLCSMIIYHAVWDLVYIFGNDWVWYRSQLAYVWQQSICWTFILLSGFCFSIGRNKIRRGMTVFGAGIIISLVTEIFMPQNRIRYGVLTLLGSCMLLLGVWEKIKLKSMPEEGNGKESVGSICGIMGCFGAFLLTKKVNAGYLGLGNIQLWELADELYELGELGNYLGFPEKSFYSTDYFSLFPWLFLFLTGYYLHKIFVEKKWMKKLEKLPSLGKWWGLFGRHSLPVYMIHQPVIYGMLFLLYEILFR